MTSNSNNLQFFPAESKSYNWKGFTAIVPSVSVGNVGQMAADLLISSLYLIKAGDLYTSDVLPAVGNDPFGATRSTPSSCQLSTSVEVYEGVAQKLVVIQQRAPLKKGHKKAYIRSLLQWIEEQHFDQLIVLCGSFAHERRDIQLEGTQQRFKFSRELERSAGERVRQLEWRELEQRTQAESTESPALYLPGAGIAPALYQECCKRGIAVGVLSQFCEEGDNIVDACQLASYLNSWLNLIDGTTNCGDASSKWRIPLSWCLLYGNSFDRTLYD